jgi:WD40 repeat protein
MPSTAGFVLRQCSLPQGEEAGKATLACPSDAQPVTAIAREPSLLTIHNQDGEHIGDKKVFAAPIAKLAWQPGSLTIAAGLENGSVELFTLPAGGHIVGDQERSSHKASITMLKWSPDGSRLLSGDAVSLNSKAQAARGSPVC